MDSLFLLFIYLFLFFSCLGLLYILNINLLSDVLLANMFSHSVGSTFMFFLLLCNYSCPHCPQLLSPALPSPIPTSILPTPLSLSLGPLYMFLDLTLPFFSPLSCSSLPSGYCHFVLYFHVSGSILLTCFFCELDSNRWDHRIFVFYHLAYFT